MARKRPSEPDEGQFSLDDFINQEPADAESVPEMIDLSPQPKPAETLPGALSELAESLQDGVLLPAKDWTSDLRRQPSIQTTCSKTIAESPCRELSL